MPDAKRFGMHPRAKLLDKAITFDYPLVLVVKKFAYDVGIAKRLTRVEGDI